ncbi:hypothetical protein MACH24_09110 [Erythrobacter sp. Dej080120_24]|uniref:DUF1838 family protein n=1 Tax=Erythrobacter sp. Dej080120_24 TaxID=3024837 RepID=UPI002926B5D8|nr:hypothetical protein MACH24_09110 [Erythrobacter sp. Dej080120_24]
MTSKAKFERRTSEALRDLAVDRRSLMAIAAASAPMIAFGSATAQTTRTAPALDRLEALVKMRGSTDARLGFSWMSGTRFARVGQDLRAMCGLLNCTLSRYTRLSDEAYDLRLYEMSFYTNPETGRYQPRLAMPFTGRIVDVPLYRTGPGQHIVKTSNREEMSWSRQNTTSEEAARQLAPDGNIFYAVDLSEPTIVGNDVWLTTEATTRLEPHSPDEKPWNYKEVITNHGRLDELSDPQVSHVQSVSSYTLVMDWRPWMHMDGVEGQTIDHAIGGRVWRIDDLPDSIASHIREHHPDVAADPAARLAA